MQHSVTSWSAGLKWLERVGWIVVGLLALGGCSEAPTSDNTSPVTKTAMSPVPVSSSTPLFTDVTAASGIHFQHEAGASGNKWYPETMGSGGGFVDTNGDGHLDIVLVNGRRWPGKRQEPEPTMHLYRNQGDGTFQDVTATSNLAVPLYGMGMAAADYDNDGDQDLVITGYRETLMFANDGSGTFTNVTAHAGLPQGTWTTAAAFVDVDRDGWLDLLLGQYVTWEPRSEKDLDCTYGTPAKDYCAVKYFQGQGLRFLRNLRDGRFRDDTVAVGMEAPEARVLGITIVDPNQDNWPDVLVATDLTPSLFFVNQGNGTFRETGVQSGLVLDEGGVAFAGMGIDAAYVNNDAQLCVAIGNFAGQPTTLHCQAQVGQTYRPDVFIEQSHRMGVAQPTLRMVTFGLFFFDADLDGWQDLFMVNGHVVNEEHLRNVPYAQRPQLLRNQGTGRFIAIPPEPNSGLDLRLIGRGAAYGDYDHDGDLDVLITANQGAAHLLQNSTTRDGHFVRIVTRGTRSNRDGIGARVRLQTNRRQFTRHVRTGGSYLSQSDLGVTFGIQPDERIVHLEVVWPSGTVDTFRTVPLDTTFLAREGAAPAHPQVARPSPTAQQPTDIFAAKHLGITHYRAGRFPAALTAFQQALQRQPDDYIVQQYLIELHWQQGSRDKALALLARMRDRLPEANFFMQFAFHLEENGAHELAQAVYATAAQLDPQAPEALYRLGKQALQHKQYAQAVHYFEQALTRRDNLLDAVQGLGLAYAAQGQTAKAEAQFHQVLTRNPNYAEAYTHLGKLYLQTKRLSDALAAYHAVTRLQPDRAQSYHNLGTVLAAQGNLEAAIQQFREALRRDARYAPAHNDLGALYAEQGELHDVSGDEE